MRTCRSWPNSRRAKAVIVPFRSAIVMFSPIASPSTWWNMISLRVRDLLVAVAHARQDDADRLAGTARA